MQVIYVIYEKLLYSVASPVLIFSATVLPGSDDFVLFFDSLDGNGTLFRNVLCDIPVLRINLI